MKYLLSLLMIVTLSACGTTPPARIVYETKYIVIKPDPTLLVIEDIPAPPAIDLYMSSSLSERETMLTEYASDLMLGLSSCNIKLSKVDKFVKGVK